MENKSYQLKRICIDLFKYIYPKSIKDLCQKKISKYETVFRNPTAKR